MVGIELHVATKKKNGVEVFYSVTDDKGTADVKMLISEESLMEYIVDNDLNLETFVNYNIRNLECDGLDERYTDPEDYLYENLDKVVKEYLETEFLKAA
jgi:hypothetical protein